MLEGKAQSGCGCNTCDSEDIRPEPVFPPLPIMSASEKPILTGVYKTRVSRNQLNARFEIT